MKAKEEDLARIGLDEKKVRHLCCCISHAKSTSALCMSIAVPSCKFKEKKCCDDTMKAKEEDLAWNGLDEKKVRQCCSFTSDAYKHVWHCNRCS